MELLVLKEDLPQAKSLYHLCYHCLDQAKNALIVEELDLAESWVASYRSTKKSLDKLFLKKELKEKRGF